MHSPIFSVAYFVGFAQVMFECNLRPIFFSIIINKNLFLLRAFLLTSSSNDASANIVDVEGSFEFSPKTKFASTLYVHIILATNNWSRIVLCTTTAVFPTHFETLIIQMLFKRFIAWNRMLRGLFMHYIFFSKFSFLIHVFETNLFLISLFHLHTPWLWIKVIEIEVLKSNSEL